MGNRIRTHATEPSAPEDAIIRDLDGVERAEYDLIVVGGGIQGVTLTLEAARSGLHPLLIERRDFGHATSGNSLRILHGGLRYLQSLDLPRFFASVAERRWFARHFPELVRPLPCLMPLYGSGLRRPVIMRGALALNDMLSAHRNRDVPASARLPGCRVLDPEDAVRRAPAVERNGLLGAALWHDLLMPSSERVLMEILRWAVGQGAGALNYVEAVGLRTSSGRVTGIEAGDLETGRRLNLRAPVVVNCAGPWSGQVTDRLNGSGPPDLPLTLAFNLLLDRPPPSDIAVAVESPENHTYFLLPWHGRLLAGTAYSGRDEAVRTPQPTEREVDNMIADLNRAVAGFGLSRGEIVRVFAGLLPATGSDSDDPKNRDMVINHGKHGQAHGLYTLVGVKYTTARRLSERALRAIFGDRTGGPESIPRRPPATRIPTHPATEEWFGRIISEESVLHLDDLLLRRTYWDGDEGTLHLGMQILSNRRGWSRSREESELARVYSSLGRGPR